MKSGTMQDYIQNNYNIQITNHQTTEGDAIKSNYSNSLIGETINDIINTRITSRSFKLTDAIGSDTTIDASMLKIISYDNPDKSKYKLSRLYWIK